MSAPKLPSDATEDSGSMDLWRKYHEWNRLDWISRTWRDVARDYCLHAPAGKSCANCRHVVSDVADLFSQKTAM